MLLRLHDATHLVYRPRKYVLPTGETVDSLGRPWEPEPQDDDNLVMEKVSLSLVDDLTIGDAINFYTIHEAPYRPYLTYRAMCSVEGYLLSGQPTTVRMQRTEPFDSQERPASERSNGRLRPSEPSSTRQRTLIGPPGHNIRPLDTTDDSEE
jgi:hypothetical protein